MRKIDQYRRHMEQCLTNSAKAPFTELRAVWETLGNSYAFLAELEAWPGFQRGHADGLQAAGPADQLSHPPGDERTPP